VRRAAPPRLRKPARGDQRHDRANIYGRRYAGTGKLSRQRAGSLAKVLGRDSREDARINSDIRDSRAAAMGAARQQQMAWLAGEKNVMVCVALIAAPRICPLERGANLRTWSSMRAQIVKNGGNPHLL